MSKILPLFLGGILDAGSGALFLKRLELCGFKTFAERTVLEFTPGLMAIVGPNGSGKSNLTDAVRYVLGEQSARTLRAQKQEELIFAGTPQRPPAAGCEVTLTFDNGDQALPIEFAEVALTRRVTRQGDSQYFINQTPCRLRDIQELLMGSGVGPGSFYMLGGREIDMVLSSDPRDRRSMLEETAGTNRYRVRRKEALRKLDQAQENLGRLKDLQVEVEANTESSRQALATYERYRRAQEELRRLEGRMVYYEFRSAQRDFLKVDGERSELYAASQEADKNQAALQSAIEEAQAALEARQREREELYQRSSDLKAQLSFTKASQDGLERRLQSLELERQSLAQRRSSLEERRRQGEAERLELQAGEEESRRLLAEARAQARQWEEELELLPGGEGELLKSKKAELAKWRGQAERLELEEEEALRSLERDGRRLELARAELDSLPPLEEGESQELEELTVKRQRLGELEAQRQAYEGQLAQWRQKVASGRQRRPELERQRRQGRSKVMELEATLEERLGMPQPVRALLAWRERGVRGAVAELIKVRSGMETALEVALGGRLYDVLVEDRRVASHLIERLKRERAGRVTFWPLDLQRRESFPPALPSRQGVVGWALELIEFDEVLRPILSQMLGNTLVMEDLPSALALYDRWSQRRPHLVTVQGEFLSAVGALTGGASRQERSGLLVRQSQLQEAQRQLAAWEREWQSLNAQEEEAARQLGAGERRLAQAKEEERRLREELADLEAKNARGERERARHLNLRRHLQEELESLGDSLLAGQARRERLAVSKVEARAQMEALEGSLAQALQEEEQLGQARRELELESHKAQLRLQSLEEEYRLRERTLTQARRRQLEVAEDWSQVESQWRQLEESQRLALAEGSGLGEDIAQHEGELAGVLGRLQELGQSLEEENQKLWRQRQEQLQVARQAREYGEALSRAQAKWQSAQVRLTNAQERWQELAPRLEGEELEEEGRNLDIGRLQKETLKLRHYLANFGSVNLGARAEFERWEARSKELREQIGDIEEASARFEKIIEEMDRALITRFKETFRKVNETFAATFQEIFGGGWAKLELCDSQDWLESGVEISACPPGKKMQNLTLFSSGERALSALAFLFALLTHKPSPVVILDELDAPLDDHNVEKIARKLADFATSSQFLIVTHNRKTMEFAQKLYGVTMEKAGISKLFSVSLV